MNDHFTDADTADDDEIGEFIAISMSDLMSGAKSESPDMPPGLREMLNGLVQKIKKIQMAEDIKEHVTAEIANHVLWAYRDFEETTEPPLSIAALIHLIRVCNVSDDHILAHLAEIEHFRGYVLGVCMLAEHGESGMRMLRTLAGLEKDEDEESEPSDA